MVYKGAYKFFPLFLVTSFLLLPFYVFAAEANFSLTPKEGSFSVGQVFSVKVLLDPKGTKVNVADGTINFDNKYLSVSGLSKSGSAFTLWTAEPEFSNTNGTINFAGGSPAGFSKNSTILTIKFKAIKEGNAKVFFKSGSVLAADGKGTDIYSGGSSASFVIERKQETSSKKQDPEKTNKTTKKTFIPKVSAPEAPKISSETHKDSEKWYNLNNAEFSWDVSYEISGERLVLSKDKNAAPKIVQIPPQGSYKIDSLEDGEWFFNLQLKNISGWGKIGSKKILIDTVEPEDFDIQVVSDGVHSKSPKLYFETKDELSKMASYEVSIGDDITVNIYPENLIDGFYKIPPQNGGLKTVSVKAYDNAGNFREVKKELEIPLVVAPLTAEEKTSKEDSGISTEFILMVFFAFSTGAFFTLTVYQKKRFKKEKEALIQETVELREKTDKIFSAIGEELEEQVNALDKKPQLTQKERDFIEKMREVLDISEEIIDTEIEDLKKTTKK